MIVEFYIRLVDKVDPHREPTQYRQLHHSGDVIAIQPMGWSWGKMEISSPDHIIISAEVESIEKARSDFMAGEPFDKDKNPFPLRRKAKVNVSALPAKGQARTATVDIYAIRLVKENVGESPFVVGKDPFEVV
jgi:hypothetical protein